MLKRLLTGGTIVLGLSVLCSSAVNADVLNQRDTINGTQQTITDVTPTGFVTSIPRTINVVDNEVIQDISVTIEGLQHTFAGDLVASLSRENGDGSSTSIQLFDRIQLGNSPGGFGDSSDFDGNYTFSSIEADPTNASNPASIWSAADSIPTSDVIPVSQASQLVANTFSDSIPNSYFAADANENPLSFATNPDGTNRFAGQSTQGLWTFRIRDENRQNVGSFTGVTINFQSTPVAVVPEPSSFGLLAVGAVGGFFYLRRRKKNEEKAEA
jgi:subtilisin-like proprotein convertase family protein